jgi:hypothetical protein
MADNGRLTAQGGHEYASDEIDGIHILRFKLVLGPDGENHGDAGESNPVPVGEQTLDIVAAPGFAVGATSAQSSAVGASTKRVVLVATVDCWVSLGANPTAAAATAGSFFLAAGAQTYPLKVTPGTTKIAAIRNSESGYLSIIESA